jgi:predicted transcriptional regulator
MNPNMNNSDNKFENLKYLLGNLGIDILIAIAKGACDFQTIEIISGVPIACIKGRIPVLIDLQLVETSSKGYVLTEEGILFKQKIEKKV